MHVSAQQTDPDFTPVELTIRIESLEEAQSLYTLFNYPPIVDSVPAIKAEEVRHCLGKLVGHENLEHLHDKITGNIWKKIKDLCLL